MGLGAFVHAIEYLLRCIWKCHLPSICLLLKQIEKEKVSSFYLLTLTNRELLRAWRRSRWSRCRRSPCFPMSSWRILMGEETVMLVRFQLERFLKMFLYLYLHTYRHNFWSICCLIPFSSSLYNYYRQRRSLPPPDIHLSCWFARHVVPYCQTNAGLSVQALQMYRCECPVFVSFIVPYP